MNALPALRTVGNEYPSRPPHNIEVEQSLLGTLLVDNDIFYKVFEITTADDFYDPVHGRIYDAISKTIDAGRLADPRTLRGQFADDEALKTVGGAQYLTELAASVIVTTNAAEYAQHVHELATRRRLIAFSNEVKSIAFDQSAPPTNGEILITEAETRLFTLAEKGGSESAFDSATVFQEAIVAIEAAYKNGGHAPGGVRTGMHRLTEYIGDLQPANLYVLAGRPSMGKTACAMTLAANAAQSGAKVLFFSLEMPRVQIHQRLIARLTGIPADKQSRGQLTSDDFLTVENVREEISSWPIFIDDGTRLTAAQIRGRAIRHKRRHGLNLIVVDYLQLMGVRDPNMPRNYQIEEITQGLKSLAKELKIPVVLLSQLNRDLEKRDDKRPMMADLRDSGAIEQDADAVIFVYRHEYYLVRSEPHQKDSENDEKFNDRYARWEKDRDASRGQVELIIAKYRQGQTGTVPMKFEGWKCLFTDIEQTEQ